MSFDFNKTGLNQNAWILLKEVFKSFPEISRVTLFGSRAIGNFKPGSDIDLLVEATGAKDFDVALKISIKLNQEAIFPYQVDVIASSTLQDESVLEHIQKYGICIYDPFQTGG